MEQEDERQEYEKRLPKDIESVFFFREIALGIFHELGNSLNTISSDLLLMDSLAQRSTPELRHHLTDAIEHLRHAKALVERANWRGSLKPRLKECYLATDVVRAAVRHHLDRAKLYGIACNHSFGHRDFVIMADKDLVIQALLAVLDNAFHAIRANQTGRREILVIVREGSHNQARIEISDTGIGIAPNLTKKIFEPYFTTRPEGTGLGLFFARRLLESAGGTLQLERSAVGKGTTFSITYPFLKTVEYGGRLPV